MLGHVRGPAVWGGRVVGKTQVFLGTSKYPPQKRSSGLQRKGGFSLSETLEAGDGEKMATDKRYPVATLYGPLMITESSNSPYKRK